MKILILLISMCSIAEAQSIIRCSPTTQNESFGRYLFSVELNIQPQPAIMTVMNTALIGMPELIIERTVEMPHVLFAFPRLAASSVDGKDQIDIHQQDDGTFTGAVTIEERYLFPVICQ